MALSILTNGAVTALNVWDLPLWAWRQYVMFQDDHDRQQREANNGR